MIFIIFIITFKGTDVKENVQLAKENVQLAKCLVNSLRTSVTSAQYNVFTSQVQSIFTLSKEVLISSQLSHNALLVDAIKEQITAGHLNQNVDFVNKVLSVIKFFYVKLAFVMLLFAAIISYIIEKLIYQFSLFYLGSGFTDIAFKQKSCYFVRSMRYRKKYLLPDSFQGIESVPFALVFAKWE